MGAMYEDNGTSGNGSVGWAVTSLSGNGTSVPWKGGVYVYGGRPLVQLAHLKAASQIRDQVFGRRVSMSGGGVLAIGSEGTCGVHVLDLW